MAGIRLAWRPGTAGERAVEAISAAVSGAASALGRLRERAPGVTPTIYLVDPFPDPGQAGRIVTYGTVVCPDKGEIWMCVTSESPPADPGGALALVYGAGLPAAADLDALIEGYGLALTGAPDHDPDLAQLDLPPFPAATGNLRSAMACSFVRFLLARAGESALLEVLESAPAERPAVTEQHYGAGLNAVEAAWREHLTALPKPPRAAFMGLLKRYLRSQVRRQAEMFVYMLAGMGFTILFTKMFQHLIDSVIPQRHTAGLVTILVLLTGAFLVMLATNLRQTYLGAYVSSWVVRRMREDMFDRLQQVSIGWFHGRDEGDVLSRLFDDVTVLEEGLSNTLTQGIFNALSVVVYSVFLLTINLPLGLLVVIATPAVALVYRGMGSGAMTRSLAAQRQLGAVTTVAAENYGAQPVVKAFSLEQREQSRFSSASDTLFGAQLRLSLFGGLFSVLVTGIVTLLRLSVLGLGAWLIIRGHFTIGGLAAFMSIMGEVISPVTALTALGQQVQASTGALARIDEVLDAVPGVSDTPAARPLVSLDHAIRFEGVRFSYLESSLLTVEPTLGGIDLEIPAGRRTAIVGPSGAGKSSVLQLLLRFYEPDAGRITFDGVDVRDITLASLRGQIGVVLQDTFLFDTSIAENIELGHPGASRQAIEAAAQAAELHELITTLPDGYDTRVGERGERLSGGQRQRVAIARALLRDPAVLVLDEATSALDPHTETHIVGTLLRASEGRTTVAVTHRLRTVEGFDQIVVIEGGRVTERGNHAELLALGGMYASMWAEQNGSPAGAGATLDQYLKTLPVFGHLRSRDLARVAAHFRPVALGPGDGIGGEDLGLAVVTAGRAQIELADFAGTPRVVAELGPGDAFGLSALLGEPVESRLVAGTEAVALQVLDRQSVSDLRRSVTGIDAAMERQAASPGPQSGTHLHHRAGPAPTRRRSRERPAPPKPAAPGALRSSVSAIGAVAAARGRAARS